MLSAKPLHVLYLARLLLLKHISYLLIVLLYFLKKRTWYIGCCHCYQIIYYHAYSASKRAGLNAVHKAFAWTKAQALHPVFASEYIRKVRDFHDLALARDNDGWRIRGNGELRTFRLPAGLPVPALIYFMFSTMAISLPLAVLFFCWIATMWKGAMTFETPMLFAVGFIVLFGIAGLTGLILADVAADAQYHHSYFVVAHFHYALFAGGIMGVMTGVYYWLPKWTGHMYSEKLGKLHFWLTVFSFNLTFIPQFFLGLAGMPRRIPDYALQFAEFNAISTVGAFVLGISQLLFAWNIWCCVRGGPKVDNQVWEGAEGLEWELPSPPPHHTWEIQPVIK